MQKTKVVHITVVHRRYDSRIFYKECLSLFKAGYDVSLIVADGLGNEEKEGIKIIDIGKAEASRIKRMIHTTRKAVKVALELNADIYHFHDPDLLSTSLKLLKKGKVIFDSHEDFPALMLQRDYIPTFARRILFITARNIERYSSKRLSGIVCATETIRDKFLKYRIKSSEVVKNYPVLALTENESQYSDKEEKIACYVGGLTEVRGVREMILSCSKAGVKLLLAGEFDNPDFFNQMKAMPEWENVEFVGYVPTSEVGERIYKRASVGLVLLHKAPNHTHSIPIKQFEYMQAGLPVIASQEILFCKQVTEEENCGIVVNPLDVEQIEKAIRTIIDNPERAKQMSANAKQASADKYNWLSQEKLLIDFYKKLID